MRVERQSCFFSEFWQLLIGCWQSWKPCSEMCACLQTQLCGSMCANPILEAHAATQSAALVCVHLTSLRKCLMAVECVLPNASYC